MVSRNRQKIKLKVESTSRLSLKMKDKSHFYTSIPYSNRMSDHGGLNSSDVGKVIYDNSHMEVYHAYIE